MPEKTDKPIQKELTDEIKAIRERNKIFAATNETDTYLTLVFTCKKDREEFVRNVLPKKIGETFFDGYEIARAIGSSPQKPSLKLPKPLNK